jgi:hypothetical protein
MKNESATNAIDYLRRVFAQSDEPEIVCVLAHVSRSGLKRQYMVLAVDHGKVEHITWAVAKATGLPLHLDSQTIVIRGGGFSGAQEIADILEHVLGIEIGYREM